MIRTLQALGLAALMGVSLQVWAQMDSSSALLLKPSGYNPTPQDLDSSAYTIRNEPRKPPTIDDVSETPGTPIASPVPKGSAEKVSTSTAVAPSAGPLVPYGPPAEPATPATAASVLPATRPPVSVQVKELILGGSEEDIDEAKKQIPSEDPKANLINVSFAPAYFYNGSTSNYGYHNYQSSGPGFGLGMSLWFTPFFGLQSSYFSSVSDGVRDGADVLPTAVQEFSAGIRFRRHFGYSRRSAQLSWGIDYHDYSNRISPDATQSVGSHASGLSLALEGTVPSGNHYSHTFDLAVRPYQHYAELGTAAGAQSGSSPESNAVSLSLGGQWTLDRHNQVYWKAQYSVERDLFTGTASVPDLHTGETPNGVSITNSLAVFYFGFRWGS